MAVFYCHWGTMTYIVALACMLAIYLRAQKLELPGSYFAIFTLLVTIIISSFQVLLPGADALVAGCIAMCFVGGCSWYLERNFIAAIKSGEVSLAAPKRSAHFCARRTHDFALVPRDADETVNRINSEDWTSLLELLGSLTSVERQSFYANLNYGGISELAVLDFVNKYPQDADALILYGHVMLCKAKRLGLVPGVLPDEKAAKAVAEAFKHFRLALRRNRADAEAVCGLLLAKGFIALRDDHLENSLQQLLAVEPNHLHGLLNAAFFLINSPQSANRFVSIVERNTDEHPVMPVIARIIAHVQCIGVNEKVVTDSRIIADVYQQLRSYRNKRKDLDQWQTEITNNVVAYALAKIGDDEEKNLIMSEFDGAVSPYPWRRQAHDRTDAVEATGSLAG